MPSPNVAVAIWCVMLDMSEPLEHVQGLLIDPQNGYYLIDYYIGLLSVRQIYWFTCAFACLILFAYMFIHVIWMYNVCIYIIYILHHIQYTDNTYRQYTDNIYIQYTYTWCMYIYISTFVCVSVFMGAVSSCSLRRKMTPELQLHLQAFLIFVEDQ